MILLTEERVGKDSWQPIALDVDRVVTAHPDSVDPGTETVLWLLAGGSTTIKMPFTEFVQLWREHKQRESKR